VTSIIGKH